MPEDRSLGALPRPSPPPRTWQVSPLLPIETFPGLARLTKQTPYCCCAALPRSASLTSTRPFSTDHPSSSPIERIYLSRAADTSSRDLVQRTPPICLLRVGRRECRRTRWRSSDRLVTGPCAWPALLFFPDFVHACFVLSSLPDARHAATQVCQRRIY